MQQRDKTVVTVNEGFSDQFRELVLTIHPKQNAEQGDPVLTVFGDCWELRADAAFFELVVALLQAQLGQGVKPN